MTFTFLTIAIPFQSARLAAVDCKLRAERKNIKRNSGVWKELYKGGVHFLSITTIPGDTRHSAFLVIESTHDGGKADAIRCLVECMPNTLKVVFKTAGIKESSDNFSSLLKKRSIDTGLGLLSTPGLNHCGAPGMTVDRIREEHDLAEAVRGMVAKPKKHVSALKILIDIRQQVENNCNLQNTLEPDDVSFLAPKYTDSSFLLAKLVLSGLWTFTWPYLIGALLASVLVTIRTSYSGDLLLGFCLGILTLVSMSLALMAILSLLYYRLRAKEKSDEPDDTLPDYSVLSEVKAIEDDGDVNHLAAISAMKPGRLRNLTLRLAFWVVNRLARWKFKPGYLGSLGTILSARWVLLPGTDKLLFFSNYGGSWESYLEDFITKAATGLTGVWSNTYGYPRTANLFFKGAVDGDRFKRWARRQQRPSYFWYCAYPNTTPHLIRQNAAIRYGLISASTENEAADWLSLFGSRVRKPASIESHEVQSLLFGGMRKLQDATCYLLRLPGDSQKSRAWLGKVAPNISFGDRPPDDSAQIIAFTHNGLERFGNEEVLAEFPAAFRQGMSASWRAKNVLKDTGEDAPEKWVWGNGRKNQVDAALIVYAAAECESCVVDKVSAEPLRELKKHGGRVVAKIKTKRLPSEGPIREAFGFVDGVSQPIIRGTPRWMRDKDPLHVVEPGEFILGYPDNRGYMPSTPTVPSSADPRNFLPEHCSIAVEHDWPDFSKTGANTRRDIGKNGSFLVIRQMEQKVEYFKKCFDQLAKCFKDHPGRPPHLTEQQFVVWLKSKAVGRWPDGTSLVRYPHQPGTGWSEYGNGRKDQSEEVTPDNSFLLGTEDPEGLSCPFGAHIRRTNPRESFLPGSSEQLTIVNRHRILRVGRPYDMETEKNDDADQGLLFMCLNGDLERQFEFIQQTWVNSQFFHGLAGEVDAIVGRGKQGGQLTIPTAPGPVVISGFKDFVTVRGGAYFFLPSRSAIKYLYTGDG